MHVVTPRRGRRLVVALAALLAAAVATSGLASTAAPSIAALSAAAPSAAAPSTAAPSAASAAPGTASSAPRRTADDCRPSVALHNPDGLRPWWNALRVVDTRRADVLLVGDSITEGVGATWKGRLPSALQEALRARFPLAEPQGVGHVPAANWSGLRVPGLRVVAGRATAVSTHGLGSKALSLGAGAAVELTFTGNRVGVWWGTPTAGSGSRSAPGAVSVDGGPAVPLSGAANSRVSGRQWVSPRLLPGRHTVRVEAGAGGLPLLLEGFEVLGSEADRTSGVHVLDGSHGGWSSHGWVPSLRPSAVRHWTAASALAPDLTVVDLGVNDWFWHTTPAQLRSNLQQVVAAAAAADDGPHAVLVVVPYRVARDPRRWPPHEWAPLRRAILATAGGNVAVLDLARHWPALSPGRGHESGVMREDRFPVHPNREGHRRIADLVARALTPQPGCL